MRSYSGLGVPGAGIGADRMFLLDPQMGKRRRAVFRDKTVRRSAQLSLSPPRLKHKSLSSGKEQQQKIFKPI